MPAGQRIKMHEGRRRVASAGILSDPSAASINSAYGAPIKQPRMSRLVRGSVGGSYDIKEHHLPCWASLCMHTVIRRAAPQGADLCGSCRCIIYDRDDLRGVQVWRQPAHLTAAAAGDTAGEREPRAPGGFGLMCMSATHYLATSGIGLSGTERDGGRERRIKRESFSAVQSAHVVWPQSGGRWRQDILQKGESLVRDVLDRRLVRQRQEASGRG
ncbi:hypothetical protein E2C01_041947 [Portunus trituberculatus]|uniref:Uncharacterized protein n=1 Tax=Portunus trituberculatus TaxID=210409 RepID=A0A5B7FSD2_PORTR|nr:hypothetical protein [Portunus trituberculatus]